MSAGKCLDCDKQLRDPYAKRCSSCAAVERMSRPGARQEVAEGVSKASKEMWANPEFRARMKVLHATPEFRAAMARDNQKVWTPASRQKFSETLRRLWADPNSVFNSPEYKAKKSASAKQQWAKGLCDDVFDSTSAYEVLVAHALDNLGVRYQQQYRPAGYYRLYDFHIPVHNVLMEVDGNFWHHSEWAIKYGIPERDAEKEQWALDNGYGFVRLGEDVVLNDNLQSLLEECFQKGGPICC